MELIAEYDPPRDRERILAEAEMLAGVFDAIDIPDAPLGKPNYSSPVYSAFLAAHGYRVVAHLRVTDVNVIAFKTITKTLGVVGVDSILYLRGDLPQQGSPVDQVTPEEAVAYALRRPEAPKPGLLISLRKPLEEISGRIAVGARFYYVLNFDWKGASNLDKLEVVSKQARKAGSKVYVYLVRGVPDTEVISSVARIADGLIVSEPGAPATRLLEAGRILRASGSG